jgi:hypothetical protein
MHGVFYQNVVGILIWRCTLYSSCLPKLASTSTLSQKRTQTVGKQPIPFYKHKTMKLNLLSLVSFFAIPFTVNGQFLRGGDGTTVQVQELPKDEPVATLDLDANEAHLEFFDEGDAILIVGTTRTNSEEDREELDPFSNGLSPVEIFERLSRQAAPADLVNAQNRIEKLVELRPARLLPQRQIQSSIW